MILTQILIETILELSNLICYDKNNCIDSQMNSQKEGDAMAEKYNLYRQEFLADNFGNSLPALVCALTAKDHLTEKQLQELKGLYYE